MSDGRLEISWHLNISIYVSAKESTYQGIFNRAEFPVEFPQFSTAVINVSSTSPLLGFRNGYHKVNWPLPAPTFRLEGSDYGIL